MCFVELALNVADPCTCAFSATAEQTRPPRALQFRIEFSRSCLLLLFSYVSDKLPHCKLGLARPTTVEIVQVSRTPATPTARLGSGRPSKARRDQGLHSMD